MISNLWFQIFLPLYMSGKEHRNIGILHVDDISVCRIFCNVVQSQEIISTNQKQMGASSRSAHSV